MSFVLSACSTADISKEHFMKRDIKYLCFHFYLDDVHYMDNMGESIPFDVFYQKMVDGAMTRTSQPNADEYVEHFRPFLANGQDILHLTLSSGISGAINSAKIAAGIMQEEFPDRKIIIIDSLGASSGFGLLMDKLADLRDEGKSIDEVADFANSHLLNLCSWFFTTDLTFFIRGGRVSKTAGFVGKVLNICPLLNIDREGKLSARDKIRTKKKVIEAVVSKMEELADDGLDYSGKCFISHSACFGDAKATADLIESRFKKLDGPVVINNIGTTIGSHTGPGTVAVFWWGKERDN